MPLAPMLLARRLERGKELADRLGERYGRSRIERPPGSRVVIVEEGSKSGGVGAEIAAGLAERCPGVRIERVASPDIPVPFTPILENAYRPDATRIAEAARRLVAGS